MTTKNNDVQGASAKRVLVLTRVFDAPRHLVFQAWTKQEHLKKWSAPQGFTIPRCHGDLRPGGEWGCLMIAPDGSKHEVTGVYREVVADELLVMTHAWLEDDGTCPWETVVTVRFADEGSMTKLTLEQSNFKSVESRDGHNDGWSQCFDKLRELLALLATPGELGGFVDVRVAQDGSASSDTSDREILVTRVFDAPRELVWQAMTNPAHVVKWWGPLGFTMTIEVMNVKPGGIWNHVMHGPDGTDYPNKSIFTEVVEPERIVYTNVGGKVGAPEANFVATWTFDVVEPGKTRLTMRCVFKTTEERDTIVKVYGAIEGGKQTMERLATLLAQEASRRGSRPPAA